MEVFIFGTFGGLLYEFLGLWKLRHNDSLPKYIHKPFFWIMAIFMSMIGGGLAYLYSSSCTINAFLAINIGITAPAILARMTAKKLEITD